MSRISDLFRNRNRPVFIAYIVSGDPDEDTSVALARQLIENGADILELGMAFSDPVADGPTIQRAGGRALASGATPDQLFAIIRKIRGFSQVPIVIMTYYNPVFRRGVSRFYEEARSSGADGILVVDLPHEEAGEALALAKRCDLDQIFLVAPTTSESRLKEISGVGSGYLYLVSVLGVTGARCEVSQDATVLIANVRKHTALPLCVGFGISIPAHARALAKAGADGVIIGSAIVDIIEKNLESRESTLAAIGRFTRGITDALK
ncbi:MAG: tryptophan synthase subunit alpha [Methanoregulaceae archaeon]